MKRTILASLVLATTVLWAGTAFSTSVQINTGGASVNVGNGGGSVETDAGLVAWGTQAAPGANYVRVDPAPLGGEAAAPGFWRVRAKAGFVWNDGRWQGDLFIPGFWRPAKIRRGMAWVPGHWYGRRWIEGRWRPERRNGYTWIEGHWDREGLWIEGFWRPLAAAATGMIWEPGYWGPDGWVDGFWRPTAKPESLWIAGEWDGDGRWIPGHWQRAQQDEYWVRGYWDNDGRYCPGRVIRLRDRNSYRHGHYDRSGRWVAPLWSEEKRRTDARQLEHAQDLREQRVRGNQPAQDLDNANVPGYGQEPRGHESRRQHGYRDDDGRNDREDRYEGRTREKVVPQPQGHARQEYREENNDQNNQDPDNAKVPARSPRGQDTYDRGNGRTHQKPDESPADHDRGYGNDSKNNPQPQLNANAGNNNAAPKKAPNANSNNNQNNNQGDQGGDNDPRAQRLKMLQNNQK